MATKKQQAQTQGLAPPNGIPVITAPPAPPKPPPLSDMLTIKRVDNGFVLEASTPEHGFRAITKRVANGAAALQAEVAAWINPAPKKR